MDHLAFDELTRLFAHALSRRRLLGLGLTLLAPLASSPRTAAQQSANMGDPCTTTDDCVQMQGCNHQGEVLCADNGMSESGELTCCLAEGGFCGDDQDCCGEWVCVFLPEQGTCSGTCRTQEWIEEHAEAITQRFLTTPFPSELLSWGSALEPSIDEDFENIGGFYADVDIDTGRSESIVDRVDLSSISYHVYLETWQAQDAYYAWTASNPDWLTDNLELDGAPFVFFALLRANPDPQSSIAVCSTVVSNVLIFATLMGGDDVYFPELYGNTVGNCRAAVTHALSVIRL